MPALTPDSNNIFVRVLRQEIPSKAVYEDDRVYAFEDINPAAPTHILIIPKDHFPTTNHLDEGDESLVGHLVVVAARIAKERGFADRGYRLVINCNPDGGQTVYHLHLHLLAGRPLHWPPG